MSRSTTRLLYATAGLVAGLAIAWSWSTFASGSELDTDVRVFPYNGSLENNGSAYTGTVQLQFQVTDDASCTYTETQTVSVAAGKFAVNIGSTTTTGVPSCVFNAQRVYLVISIKGPNDTGFTALSNRQRIRPVPFAMWSAEGSDFKIDGTISSTGNITTTGGGVTASGALTGASLTTTGAATIGGSITASGSTLEFKGYDFKFGTNDGRTTANTGRYAMVHTSADKLVFNFGSGFTSGLEFNGPNVLYGGTTIGSGRPASGVSQLRLADSFDDTLDNMNDYQIILHTGGGTGTSTYGIGVQTSTVFVNSVRYHKFMVGGTTKFTIDGSGTSTLATPLTLSGALSGTSATFSSDVTLTGTMKATTIKGQLSLTESSATISSNASNQFLQCTTSTDYPISCGVKKDASGDEDSVGCWLDLAAHGCRFFHDDSSGTDGTTGFCYCLSRS